MCPREKFNDKISLLHKGVSAQNVPEFYYQIYLAIYISCLIIFQLLLFINMQKAMLLPNSAELTSVLLCSLECSGKIQFYLPHTIK
jgi:hypothetical protein